MPNLSANSIEICMKYNMTPIKVIIQQIGTMSLINHL